MLSVFSVAHAQLDTTYVPLAPLDNAGVPATSKLSEYIPAVFKLSIGIAAVLAFVMITFGGIMYATSDAITGKSAGREYITNALWGLLLVLGAYAILYTINPKILKFDLNLQRPTITTPAGAAVAVGGTIAGGGTGAVSCQGNCPFSYTNGSGVLVNYKDCSSCANATSFGLNIKTQQVNGTVAQINTGLGNKLKGIQNTSGAPAFQVTETWPPTVNHAAQGQYDGTSVDVSLANPNAQNIISFINTANAQGLRVVYEVSTPAQAQAYQNAGVPPANITPVGYITGEHFSVYTQ